MPIVALVLAGCLVGCGNNKGNEQQESFTEVESTNYDLDSILKRGKLRVAVANSSSSYFIYRGQPVGFEYELLKILADSLGVELEIEVATDLDQIFNKLSSGECDLLAAHLTVTKTREKAVTFIDHHATTRQVLIQRKPANFRQLHQSQIDKQLILDPIDLIGKEIFVRKNSSYYDRLVNLSDEIGGEINVMKVKGDVETEELIEMVSNGEIDYTVADEEIAEINTMYYGNLDCRTAISFNQKIAFAIRKSSPALEKRLNNWMASMKRHPALYHLRKKYLSPSKAQLARLESDYNSESGGKISKYDDIIKKHSDKINWDWRLLASLIYQESRFDNDLVSWAGARGLMQLMPQTSRRFGGGDSNSTPEQSIAAGVGYIDWLNKFWSKNVPDSSERISFILASYNAGHGHVLDAWRLAKKYGKDPGKWQNSTEDFLAKMSLKKYYSDEVVENGYCGCKQPVRYVKEIIGRFNQYKELIPFEELAENRELSQLIAN